MISWPQRGQVCCDDSTRTGRPAPEREEYESKPVALRGHAGSTSWPGQRGGCPIRDNPGQRTSFQQTEILGKKSRVGFTRRLWLFCFNNRNSNPAHYQSSHKWVRSNWSSCHHMLGSKNIIPTHQD